MKIVSNDTPIQDGPFKVGHYYIRPAIQIITGDVLAYLHDHVGDISGEHHYHVDARFISDKTYKRLDVRPDFVFGASGDLVRASLCCHREVIPPVAFFSPKSANNFRMIEERSKGKKCNGKVCPHQGCDLGAVEPTKVGEKMARVCPCHGLQWNVESGSLIPRVSLETINL